MALPANIDPASPAGTDQVSSGDDQIRAFKQFLVDILGLPTNPTNMTAALMDANADGTIASSISIALKAIANTFTQRQTFALTQDVDLSGITGALIVGGDGTGPHIAIDANEIVAKSNATTGAVLALNNNGDISMGGTARLIQGIIPFSRTAEFFIASFTAIANGAESEVILGHGLATDNVHFTLMTNQPQVSGYSLSITRPDGFAHTYSNGAVPSPGVTSASSATVTVRLRNNTGGALTIGFKIAIIGE